MKILFLVAGQGSEVVMPILQKREGAAIDFFYFDVQRLLTSGQEQRLKYRHHMASMDLGPIPATAPSPRPSRPTGADPKRHPSSSDTSLMQPRGFTCNSG